VKALCLILGGLVLLFFVSGYWRIKKAHGGRPGAYCLYLQGEPGN
jgi:hypothetical protein